jgi:glyoxylase-like metal-dependent hydrolase (beta-lactamase superfamily II)
MTVSPTIRSFFDEATNTVTHLVADPITGHAAIIDPVLDFDPASGRTSTKSVDAVLSVAQSEGWNIVWSLETHAHADHLSGAPVVKERTGAKIGIGEHIRQVRDVFGPMLEVEGEDSDFDRLFADGDRFSIGELEVEVIATPGHTPACVSYRIGNAVFVGDTLFMPDYGTARCDFPGGDARQLYRSIKRLLSLPPETRLFMCHDYKAPGRDHFAWETTVAEERAKNPHVHDGISEEEFVAMREGRDATLAVPKLLYPAIQVNIRAGKLPPAEANGRRYIRIPLEIPAA